MQPVFSPSFEMVLGHQVRLGGGSLGTSVSHHRDHRDAFIWDIESSSISCYHLNVFDCKNDLQLSISFWITITFMVQPPHYYRHLETVGGFSQSNFHSNTFLWIDTSVKWPHQYSVMKPQKSVKFCNKICEVQHTLKVSSYVWIRQKSQLN